MKIIMLMLGDLVKSKVFKGLMIFIGICFGLWLLSVPSLFIIHEWYSQVPVLREALGLVPKMDFNYLELFHGSYSSLMMVVLHTAMAVLSMLIVVSPFAVLFAVLFMLFFMLFFIIVLILYCIRVIIEKIMDWKWYMNRINDYIEVLKKRAKEK